MCFKQGKYPNYEMTILNRIGQMQRKESANHELTWINDDDETQNGPGTDLEIVR